MQHRVAWISSPDMSGAERRTHNISLSLTTPLCLWVYVSVWSWRQEEANKRTKTQWKGFGKAQKTHKHTTLLEHIMFPEMRQVHAWLAELDTCVSVHVGRGGHERIHGRTSKPLNPVCRETLGSIRNLVCACLLACTPTRLNWQSGYWPQ